MKKIVNVLILLCFVCVTLFPFDFPLEELRNYDFSGKAKLNSVPAGNEYFFNGFDFGAYNPSEDHDGLKKKIQAEALSLKEYGFPVSDDHFYFMGHSQGGLRAMAAAAWLYENEPEVYDRLDCVITMSGINRGLKALDGGVGVLAARINNDYRVLFNGAVSVEEFIDMTLDTDVVLKILDIVAFFVSDVKEAAKYAVALYLAIANNYDNLDIMIEFLNTLNIMPELSYIVLALRGQKMQEIEDMVPRSDFINDTLVLTEGETKIARVFDRYRIEAGVRWVFIPILGFFLPFSYTNYVPEYRMEIVYPKEGELRIGEDMPVGYLVGLNNDFFSMAPDADKLREALYGIGVLLDVTAAFHIASTFCLFGYVYGSPRHYADALNASYYLKTIDQRVSSLLGSQENDGLVAKESQFYPKSIHGNILLYSEYGDFVGFPNHNHSSIADKSKNQDVQFIIEKMLKEARDQRGFP